MKVTETNTTTRARSLLQHVSLTAATNQKDLTNAQTFDVILEAIVRLTRTGICTTVGTKKASMA